MNNMDYKLLANKIFEKGRTKLDELEVYIQSSKDIEIGIFGGEIDNYAISESGGLSLRGIVNDKMGYSYTEKIDESSIDMLVDEALENGKYIDSVDKENIFSGSDKYEKTNTYSDSLEKTPIDEKINFLKKLEKEALSLDSRVSNVQMCIYQEMSTEKYLINTKGLDLADKMSGAFAYIYVIVKDGEEVKNGTSFRGFNDFSKFDYKEMAKEAVDEAISMLGASSIKSSDYPVIIRNTTFADVMSAFTPVFSADNVQKGLSLLKDKIGTPVANELLTMVDNPFLEGGFATRSFDDEGTATRVNKIIDKGILKTHLHNWKTAEKDKIESTGNGTRSSYKGSLSISPSNLYIEKGSNTYDELVASIDKGLIIIDVAGLHSGLNTVSGDFSLSAYGYEIENGKIKRPVDLITIAGNLYEVLNNIEAIGDDLKFGLPGAGYIGSPSIKIKSLSVAGE